MCDQSVISPSLLIKSDSSFAGLPPCALLALQIQESVLGKKHKVVSSTRDSLNFVTKSIKNRDSPPPPPSSRSAEAKSKSSNGQNGDSMLFGLFDNYLTCSNLNVAEEIESWVGEYKKFQESVNCS